MPARPYITPATSSTLTYKVPGIGLNGRVGSLLNMRVDVRVTVDVGETFSTGS